MKDETIVFLVDDDDDDRMFTREALESVLNEIELVEFNSGRDLVAALSKGEVPSLILMDINMPCLSGMETLSIIKSIPEVLHIPVILFSTSSDPDTIRQAYQAGVNAYIVKPVSSLGYSQVAEALRLCFFNKDFLPAKNRTRLVPLNRSILVVEDNADHWSLMRIALQTLGGVQLVHTESAERTMAFLHAQFHTFYPAIDLIILDLNLPGRQEGLELIEKIRDFFISQNLAPLPVIIFSASDHREDVEASYQRKANVYLTKSSDLVRSALYLNDVCKVWSQVIVPPTISFS